MHDGTCALSGKKTVTRCARWARSLGGRVSSRHWLPGAHRPCPSWRYCQTKSRRPHTNQAQPDVQSRTLTVEDPVDLSS